MFVPLESRAPAARGRLGLRDFGGSLPPAASLGRLLLQAGYARSNLGADEGPLYLFTRWFPARSPSGGMEQRQGAPLPENASAPRVKSPVGQLERGSSVSALAKTGGSLAASPKHRSEVRPSVGEEMCASLDAAMMQYIHIGPCLRCNSRMSCLRVIVLKIMHHLQGRLRSSNAETGLTHLEAFLPHAAHHSGRPYTCDFVHHPPCRSRI
jgi:hypothetical protein